MKLSKKVKAIFIVLVSVGFIAFIVLAYAGINVVYNNNLISYIDSLEPIQYENQIDPIVDENGYTTFETDREFKVMQLNDLHIGGGSSTPKEDKKVLYEIYTMIKNVKPDLVILVGDNIFACPGPIFNGGGTLNNKMDHEVVLHFFEHIGVYFSTTFGNHDTEAFDYYNRVSMGELYEKGDYKYCVFKSDFSDDASKLPSVTNQFILIKDKNTKKILKNLMLVDSNAYVDNTIAACLAWDYDVIRDVQVEWAKSSLMKLNSTQDEQVKSLAFFHIPVSEFQYSLTELYYNDFKDTEDSKYISGVWDEEPINGEDDKRIFYGGYKKELEDIRQADKFFEELGPQGMNSLEGIFVGHDHVNNGVIEYKGVLLSYNYGIDNTAYTDVMYSGLQRGCTVIDIQKDGSWEQHHLNAYKKLGVSTSEIVDVYLDHPYHPNYIPTFYDFSNED